VGLVETGIISVIGVGKIALYAVLFFIVSIILGINLVRPLFRVVDALKIKRTFLIGEFLLALVLSLIANLIGLTTILGAFIAGLILEKTKYHEKIEHRVHPLSNIFVPIFFVMVGAHLNIWTVFEPGNLKLIFMLLAIAVIGKAACGIGAVGSNLRKSVIAVGMIPRGEVGLVLASFGLAAGVIQLGLYSVIVVVIMLTTLIAPPLLALYSR
jgi:Kef-type K+ transport system membrane component KefB